MKLKKQISKHLIRRVRNPISKISKEEIEMAQDLFVSHISGGVSNETWEDIVKNAFECAKFFHEYVRKELKRN